MGKKGPSERGPGKMAKDIRTPPLPRPLLERTEYTLASLPPPLLSLSLFSLRYHACVFCTGPRASCRLGSRHCPGHWLCFRHAGHHFYPGKIHAVLGKDKRGVYIGFSFRQNRAYRCQYRFSVDLGGDFTTVQCHCLQIRRLRTILVSRRPKKRVSSPVIFARIRIVARPSHTPR
jgi:hypothetical protein